MTVKYLRNGGRTVELFVPFEFQGTKVEAITFGPIRFDHSLRWQSGQISNILSLMSEVAGVNEEILRQVTYPDADRVMAVFVDMLPPEIRESINRAQPVLDQPVEEAAAPPAGEPIPEPPAQNGQDKAPASPFPPPSDDHGLGVDLN